MKDKGSTRREFLAGSGLFLAGIVIAEGEKPPKSYVPIPGIPPFAKWGFLVDTTKCIGCGNCMRACRVENNVPAKAQQDGPVPATAEDSDNESLGEWCARYRFTDIPNAKNTETTHTRWRTWVERYLYLETKEGATLRVDAPEGGEHGYPPVKEKVLKGVKR